MKKYNILIGTGIFWFLLDALTKGWVSGTHFKPIILIKDIFYFTAHKNTGIAFGIPVPQWIQIIGSIGILIFLTHFAITHIKKLFLNQVLFGIILGGGVGNLVNRVYAGYVTDFIVLRPFPVFNLADVGITVGIIILFVSLLQNNNQKNLINKQ